MRSESDFKRKLRLVWALAVTQWRTDTAYLGSNIAALLTPLAYISSFLVFISVLFNNISTLGGYTRDEMFFLIFIGQIAFYLTSFWGYEGNSRLQESVNGGNLDFMLLRPINPLFLVTAGKIKLLDLLLHILGPLTPTWLIVNWSNIHVEPFNLLIGLVIMFMGILLLQSIQFILTLPVFWTGRAMESHLLVYAASSQTIPLEGMPGWFKWVFTGIMPTLIASSVAASVMLGKADALFWLAITAAITVIMLGLKRVLWRAALRQYVSASS